MWHQVHVAKNDDALDVLLHDLRAPARLVAGVVALAPLEAQLFHGLHKMNELGARAAKGMVIVVPPTKAECVLSRLLHTPCAVAPLPKDAFTHEYNMAREIAPHHRDKFVNQCERQRITFVVVIEPALSSLPKL